MKSGERGRKRGEIGSERKREEAGVKQYGVTRITQSRHK